MCSAIQPSQAITALELDAVRHLQHRVTTTDRCHRALVEVGERLRLQAAIKPGDLLRSVLAHLNGRLSQLRHGVVHDDARITDGEDPFLADHAWYHD